MIKTKKFYSNCCERYIHNWPDTDICPNCKDHCQGIERVTCKECGEDFLPEKPYYHTCDECFSGDESELLAPPSDFNWDK